MLRSIWFWLLLLVVAVAILWFAQDQLTAYIPESSFNPSSRTTDTQKLAKTVSPNGSSRISANALDTANSIRTPRATVQSAGTRIVASAGTSATKRATSTAKPAATAKPSTTYKVKAGDTLYSIANKYGMDVEEVMRMNSITDPTALQVDLVLKIKTTTSSSSATQSVAGRSAPAGSQVYKIKAGDTLSSIARSSGASMADLQRLNNLANPNELIVGTTLFVPSNKVTPRSTTSSATTPAANNTASAQPSPTPNPASPTPGGSETTVSQQTQPSLQAPVNTALVADTESVAAQEIVAESAPQPKATFTPVAKSVCPGAQSIALVWGIHFCLPDGWKMFEQGSPSRGLFTVATEQNGDRAVLGIIRPEGWPNAPLSWAMRTAKSSIQDQAGVLVSGGISEPQNWTLTQASSVAGIPAQMVEATTTYVATGTPARLRLLVFNHEGQRWWVMMLAPQNRWRYYIEAGFPAILNTLSVF